MAYSCCPWCANELHGANVCPHCGKQPESYQPQPHHFPVGTVLDRRYWVGRVLGEGGFGITYLGYDAKLERRLAIKEYFPSHLVHRNNGSTEVSCYERDKFEFDKGKEQFLSEARVLAKLDGIPNVVRVLDFFSANGTAYIVMEFLEGETLKAYLRRNGRMSMNALIEMLEPVMKALHKVHQTGLIHRDISPDNLMLVDNGEQVKLMDFGCARNANSGMTMTVMLKPGFAPLEQYSGTEQGPWTDVYALCATMYHALTGKVLPNAMVRMENPEITPPSALGADITAEQERVLMKGLSLLAKSRWHDVQELMNALKGVAGKPVPKPIPRPEPKPEPDFIPDEQDDIPTEPDSELNPTPEPVSKPELKPIPRTNVPTILQNQKVLLGIAAAAVLVLILSVVGLVGGGKNSDGGKNTGAELTKPAPTQTMPPETTVPETTEADISVTNRMRLFVSRPDDKILNETTDLLYGTDIPISQICRITFRETTFLAPGDAWDLSELQNGKVLAWVEPVEGTEYYHLYIGADGGVYAPVDSTGLFSRFTGVETIEFHDAFHTEGVTKMLGMFFECTSLKELDVSGFDTSEAILLKSMFNGCSKLTAIDVSNFDTANVTDMMAMFQHCYELNSLDLSNFDTANVTDMSYMFHKCAALKSLDVSSFDTRNVNDMSCMFYECVALKSLDVSSFDTRNVKGMSYMFYECKNLTSLDVSNFDTASVTGMVCMFDECTSLSALDVSNFDTANVTDMHSMFSSCTSLTSLDLSRFDTRNVTNMCGMFSSCTSLTSLDLSSFDTRNVTNMVGMFSGCNGLTSLDLSNFDTANVTDMHSMFSSCTSLTSLDLSSFDTGNVTNMDKMFNGCDKLSDVTIGNFDTSKVDTSDDSSFFFFDDSFFGHFMPEHCTINGKPWRSYFE